MKVAVVYYSWSGNTRFAAETIAKKTGADLFEIKAETPYNSNYGSLAFPRWKRSSTREWRACKASRGDAESRSKMTEWKQASASPHLRVRQKGTK